MASSPTHAPLLLLVDDYQDSREMYAEYLELSGFRVLQAADGAEAVRVAEERLPDAVVMDLSLPKVDGREATRRLKAGVRTAGIPIVILSGMPSQYLEVTGAAGIIVKPCPPQRLVDELRRVIGIH